MGFVFRRFVLGLGAVLLVVGWGVTRYADTQQAAVAQGKAAPLTVWTGEKTKVGTWVSKKKFLPGRTLYVGGMVGMAVGAALVVFASPRGGLGRGP